MLAWAEADLVLERKRREVEVAKTKEELAEVEKKTKEKAMDVYNVSTNFMAKKAWAVVVFHMPEELYTDCHQFSKEAFHASFNLGKDDYHTQVMNHHPGLDLSFLDKEELVREHSPKHKEVATPIIMPKPPPAKATIMPFKATPVIADLKEKVKD